MTKFTLPMFAYAMLVTTACFPSVARGGGIVGNGTAASCTEAALDMALTGGGSVSFNCGGAATITVASTKIISADTILDGGRLVAISGGDAVGIFAVNGGVTFTVEGITIEHGAGTSEGRDSGGIYVRGTLSVANSVFYRNSAVSGGAIWAGVPEATTSVSNCTFEDNRAQLHGGAIQNGGTLNVTSSSFLNNRGDSGYDGAINSGGGNVAITNSTFFGNYSGLEGGAVGGGNVITITNSTFAGNSSPTLSWGTSTMIISNTVIANSSPGGNCLGDSVVDNGHNIDSGSSCGFSSAAGSLINTDPRLDPAGLQNNGGPTRTIALCVAPGVPAGCTGASPAINSGDEGVCSTTTGTAAVRNLDQRGFVRPGTGATSCSIGAFEANSSASPGHVRQSAGVVAASDQYFSASDSPSLSVTGDITVEAWVKFASMPGAPADRAEIVGKEVTPHDGYGAYHLELLKNGANYDLRALAGPDERGDPASLSVVTYASWNPSTDVWYHVAYTRVSSTGLQTLFVDGVEAGSATNRTGPMVDSDSVVTLGRFSPTGGGILPIQLDGRLSLVRIWDTALSAEAIGANRCRVYGTPTPNLQAEWSLDHVLIDGSGNGNTLANVNAASFAADIPSACGSSNVCGDGILDAGELCDDGNTVDGDCCSDDCGRAAVCDDGNPCTQDSCIAATGECGSVVVPATGCRRAGTSDLGLSVRGDGKARWKWNDGEATSCDDLGAPNIDTAYDLCIYDGIGGDGYSLAAHFHLPASELWTLGEGCRWSYSDTASAADGIGSFRLTPGETGRTAVRFGARGPVAPIPTPIATDRFMSMDPTTTVQLSNSHGGCWESQFTLARKNTGEKFKTSRLILIGQ